MKTHFRSALVAAAAALAVTGGAAVAQPRESTDRDALFHDDAKTIGFENGFSSKYVYGLGTNDARGVFSAPIEQRQRVQVRLSTKDIREGARFRLRLAGPLLLPRAGAGR